MLFVPLLCTVNTGRCSKTAALLLLVARDIIHTAYCRITILFGVYCLWRIAVAIERVEVPVRFFFFSSFQINGPIYLGPSKKTTYCLQQRESPQDVKIGT